MRAAALAVSLLLAAVVSAEDHVLGTFSVGDRTTRLVRVYAARQPDARDPSRLWLVVLLADRPVSDDDRVPVRLLALAQAERLRAVRVVWSESLGLAQATPYAGDVAHPGLPVRGTTVVDVSRDDGRRLEARLRSRGTGQAWSLDARVEATLATAGAAIVETIAEAPPSRARVEAGRAEADPAAAKERLAAMGYGFSADELVRAIHDAHAEAVAAFLDAGLSPESRGGNGYPALLHAATSCERGEPAAHVAIVRALLVAGAKPDVRDDNNATPLIWAAQFCPAEAVQALLDAGADVNARAKGGATPLMMAEVMQRAEVAERLKRAGALPWRP